MSCPCRGAPNGDPLNVRPDQAIESVSEALSFVRFKHAHARQEFVEHVAQKAPLNTGLRVSVTSLYTALGGMQEGSWLCRRGRGYAYTLRWGRRLYVFGTLIAIKDRVM